MVEFKPCQCQHAYALANKNVFKFFAKLVVVDCSLMYVGRLFQMWGDE